MPNQFPTFKGYGWPIERSPVQSTIVQTAANGKQYTQALYPFPKWKWKVSFDQLFDDYQNNLGGQQFAFQALAGFFNAVQGRSQSFLYLDPYDNIATNQIAGYLSSSTNQYVFTGNGVQQQFTLFKSQVGGVVEPVQWLQTLPQVWLNGVLETYNVNYNTSEPPFVVHWFGPPAIGATVTWSGQFLYLCRFTQDTFPFSHDFYGNYSVKDLEFESVFP